MAAEQQWRQWCWLVVAEQQWYRPVAAEQQWRQWCWLVVAEQQWRHGYVLGGCWAPMETWVCVGWVLGSNQDMGVRGVGVGQPSRHGCCFNTAEMQLLVFDNCSAAMHLWCLMIAQQQCMQFWCLMTAHAQCMQFWCLMIAQQQHMQFWCLMIAQQQRMQFLCLMIAQPHCMQGHDDNAG